MRHRAWYEFVSLAGDAARTLYGFVSRGALCALHDFVARGALRGARRGLVSGSRCTARAVPVARGVSFVPIVSAMSAVLLFAAQAPAQDESPPPPPAPVAPEKQEKPAGGDQRERFEKALERLREIGGEGDFSGFADQAREEARRRREAALERGTAMKSFGRDPLEEEMFFEEIAEAGLWGSSGCFENEEALPYVRDFFFYGPLTRKHFRGKLADEPGPNETAQRSADLFVTLTCDLQIEVMEETTDGFVVSATRADHIALASYRRSWWRRNPGRNPEAVLRHQQLHFDLAKLVADDLDRRFRRGALVIYGEGKSRAVALGTFQQRWTEHIERAREELRRLRVRYDTETRNGTDLEKQAQWEALVRAGIDALRATGGK